MRALEIARASKENVVWTSGNYTGLVPSENKADEIVRKLRREFAEYYVEDGTRPLSAVHGMASYEKYVVLCLTEEARARIREYLAKTLKRPASAVARWIEDIAPEKLEML